MLKKLFKTSETPPSDAPKAGVEEQLSPYVQARYEWDERFGGYVKQANQWRLVAYISLGMCTVSVIGCVYLSNRASIVPLVVQVDAQGGIVETEMLDPTGVRQVVSEAVYKAEIERFIRNLRSVTPDTNIQSQMISEIEARMRPGDPNYAIIRGVLVARQPFELARTQIVSVAIEEFRRLSPKSWYVEWIEKTATRVGNAGVTEQVFSATITAEQGRVDRQKARLNPLGIFITQFDMAAKKDTK